MGRKLIPLLVASLGLFNVALATDLGLQLEAMGCYSSTVTVGPSCETRYRVIGHLSDAATDGLAMLVFDLEFDGGPLAPADVPAELPMAAFAAPAGLGNPAGFGGTPIGGRLVQVGGAQNVLGQGQWPCDTADECPGVSSCVDSVCSAIPGLPLGTVVLGVAQPAAPAVVAGGTFVTPATPGTYTLQLTHAVATAFEKGADGRPYWWNHEVTIGTVAPLTITVVEGAECCSMYEGCCLTSGGCTMAPPATCAANGGVTHAGEICEGDLDADGVDVVCGDECPSDAQKTTPGTCGCGVPETDGDADGAADCVDGCPTDPLKTLPGLCGCGTPDVDSDEDTVVDCRDMCPGQDDLLDADGSGVADCLEALPSIPAVSGRGLLLLALLLLGGGILVFRRVR